MSEKSRNTVYQQYIRDTLWRLAGEGVENFHAGEFAHLAGLKLTGNLRRQLRYAVDDRILQYVVGRISPTDPHQYYTFTPQVIEARGKPE